MLFSLPDVGYLVERGADGIALLHAGVGSSFLESGVCQWGVGKLVFRSAGYPSYTRTLPLNSCRDPLSLP